MIYVNSLSKLVGGGLRAGWVAASGPVRERIATAQARGRLPQRHADPAHRGALARRRVRYDRHLEHTQPFYRERRDALLAALERHMPGEYQADAPQGGHHVWVTLNRSLDERALYTEAARHGVAFTPGGAVTAERRTADVAPPVVLAGGAPRAGRGREAARPRDPRGAPKRSPRCGRADVLAAAAPRASARARRACAARPARSGRGIGRARRRDGCVAPRRTARGRPG